MPPPEPSDHAAFYLRLLDQPFFVRQLKSGSAIPPRFLDALAGNSGRFISITTTDEEISIVGELSQDEMSDGEEALWRCIKIAGPMDFGITGVMCNFTAPLKASGIPVFAISTWNTDYILVPKDHIEQAIDALARDGWIFSS